MNTRYLLAILFSILFATSYSQNLPPGCSGALPFCAGSSSSGISFPNSTNVASPGSNSCLGSQPNAAWYYLQISQSGNLTFTIRQFNNAGTPIDVDFIAYGPFVTPSCGASNLNSTTQLPNPGGCSFSAAATETMIINNAVVGQYYMIIMTNYSNQAGSITLAQTGGTGATSCDIVCPLTIAGGGVSDCRDNILTANYLNSAQVGTTFTWTHQSSPTAPVNTIPSITGPNFVAGPPRSNNSTRTTLAYGVGTYCVTARSPGCSSTQTAVCTTINPGVPVPFNPPITINACNNSTFDLTQNTSVLLQGLPGSASNYRVRYNLNATNALTNITPIPTSQQAVFPGTQGQIIYATVWDVSGTYCYAVAQFTLNFVVCAFSTTNTGPICAGGTFNLSATDPGVGPVTYSWAGPNGFTATGANVSNVPTPTGTPPFSYVCTATPSTVGVAPLTSTTIVTVNPIPVATATAVSNSICTGSITDITIGSNVSGTTFNWTSVETNATGSSSGTGTNIAQTLTNSGNTVGTVDYTITLTANGCTGTPIHSIISVKPLPVAVATPTPATICSGSTSNIILSSTPTGATFAWTAFQTDASGASAASGSTIAQVLSSPGNFVGSVDYTITPTLNSCVGIPVHAIMTINPTPVAVATPVATTLCSGTATNIPLTSLVTGATFAWTVVQNNVSGASASNGSSIADTLTATSSNPGSVVYTITPTANGCVGLPITVTITVTPLPTATISYSGTPFCSSLTASQAVTLTGLAAYTGGVYSSTTGLTIDATTGAITPSTSTAGNYVVTYTIAANAGCSVVTATTTIVITKVPTATISYAGTPFCSTLTTGQAVTIAGTDAYTGGTYSSTAGLTIDATSGSITPSTSTAVNYVVTYTIPASAGCSSVTTTTNVVVSTSASATILYAGTPYCSGTSSANITFTGTTGGTYSATSGLIINPTTGAVDLSSPAGPYTVTYTIAASGGCAAVVVTTPITINLSSVPVTGFSYTTPVCKNGTNPVVIPVTGFTAGGSYTSTTGLSINSSTGAIDLASSAPGNYTVTYTVPASTCGPLGTSSTSIVITAPPTAAITYAGTPFCTSLTTGQVVALTGTNAYPGGAYSSTTGLTVNASTGTIIPSTSVPGNYVVTYTAPASAGCASVPATTNVVITALPTATITYAGTPFCTTLTSSQAVTLTGTGGYTGGTYSGTAGLIIDATTGAITPSTSTPGNHTITYTIPAAAGCAQVTTTTTVVITALPTAAITYSGTPFCTSLTSGQVVALTGTNAYPGGAYSSTTGLTVNASTGTIIPSTSVPGNYVVTYTAPASAGCASVPATTNVVITALPTATITYAGTPFCTTLTSSQAVTLTGTGGYSGGTYSGTAGLTINATTGAITPSTSTPGNHTITYTIAAAAGCTQVIATTTIVLTNALTVNISYAGTPFCNSLIIGQPVTLTGTSTFTGGTFSSTTGLTVDATSGVIIPSTSTVGNYVVTYTAPANSGCSSVPATTNVVITALPTATITYAGSPFCSNSTTTQAVTLTGTGGYTGGTYSGTAGLTINASTGAITPSTSTSGNHTITYTIPAALGCAQVTTTTTIVITALPTAAITYAGTPFCTSLTTGQAVTLTGTDAYTGGTYSSTTGLTINSTTGAIIPSTSTPGNYVVTYTAPGSGGCASVPATTNVAITALPTATITYAGTPFCTTLTTGQAVSLTGTGGYTGGTYSGTAGLTINTTTGAITPSTSTPGNHTITYTIPAALGCAQVITTTNIIVNPIPIATATPTAITICSLDTTNIALTSNAIGTTYVWTAATTNITGASSASGNAIVDALTVAGNTPGTVVYTITPSGSGCTGLPITATVTVNPLPIATISGTSSICYNSSSLINFTGTPNATVTYTVNGGANQTTTLDNLGTGSVSTGNLIATTTYQLVSVLAAGITACSQTQSGSVVVTVIPVPLVTTVVSSPTICSGQPTGISLSSNVATATYNWTVTQASVSGASAGNGSIISQVLTTTGGVPGTATYSIMANEGTCQGPATPITITVNPIPVVTPSTVLQSICSGSVSPVQLTSNVLGTVFNWNVVQTNVTGASNGTGNLIAQVLTTISNNVGEAVYSVIPTVGGCPGVPVLVTVKVNPIPVATANAAVTTICSSSTTNIALTSSVAGTTFSWTVIQTGIFGASSGTGNSIAQTLTTVSNTPGSVRYTITPSINGCLGAPISVTITVNPTPEVFGSSTSTICSGETPNISLFPSIVATTFAWTVNPINVTGAQAGTGIVINDILTASPNLGTAVYTVTPTANGCSGTPLNITVTVNPAPAPQINDGVICVNRTTGVSYKNYILNTNLSNVTYDFAWYFNGILINGAVNDSYEATQAGIYSVVVTNTATGCKSLLIQADVLASFPGTSVSTTETLAFSDNAIITVDVTGGNASFLYSLDNGPTQSSNVFTDVSPGPHVITVTDANGCTYLTQLVTIIGYPTYFTPNGDGYHETWNIVGLGDTAKVFIFDRYGKLIKQISPTGEGWDGTLNGEQLMSTDYWFTVDYKEPQTGESKVFRSHFSLKR